MGCRDGSKEMGGDGFETEDESGSKGVEEMIQKEDDVMLEKECNSEIIKKNKECG